ncbi:IgGFc-binding protein-like isoform X5 [Aphelocoma coerulescens]|uniref:IgGFc-binding protein-like isoform X5 n=1 Tax=Aphelocoma coerulescens TaxID=39617 RepID=UPI003604FA41
MKGSLVVIFTECIHVTGRSPLIPCFPSSLLAPAGFLQLFQALGPEFPIPRNSPLGLGSFILVMAQDGIWWLLLPFCALSSASYRGREFLAVFPQNDDESPSAYLQLLLTSYGPADTQVSVTLRGGSVTRSVTLGPDLTVPLSLPADLELTGSRTSHKTLVVQASADISVVAVSTKSYTVGATALLPVESLGTRYYVVTPVGNYTYGLTEFVVAAGAATTAVSITTTATFHYAGATYVPGAVLCLLLQPYHSLQLQSSQDFTGTAVVADSPVAVLSGHPCVKVSAGFDFVVEQLLPITAWGKNYVVPPNPLQTDVDFVYVVTDEDNTITYNTGSRNATVVMAAGEVQSVPGQYNHAILVAPTTAAANTTLNHQPDNTMAWQAIPGTDFSWAIITVHATTQSAENSQVPIGLLVFGFQSQTGYGFPGLCATRFGMQGEV